MPAKETDIAREALRALTPAAKKPRPRIVVENARSQTTTVDLPPGAFALLIDILAHMANGRAVTVVPKHAQFTTQQAADFLGVSRPHVVKLLEAGEIPFSKTGAHRRIRFEDLVEYKKRDDETRDDVLRELAAEAQKHGLGY